jgi:hypothetical protein
MEKESNCTWSAYQLSISQSRWPQLLSRWPSRTSDHHMIVNYLSASIRGRLHKLRSYMDNIAPLAC